jgi:opacity protein-like surface antigen
MNAHRILPALAAAAALALAAVPSSAAAATQVPEAVSANWAGYAVGDTSATGSEPFSSVSGSWIEPTDDCTTGDGDAAFWVGLGGTEEQSESLEQIGTEADCSASGSADYFACP